MDVAARDVQMRLFIDESYGTDDYYVAGVLVTEAQYRNLVDGLEEVRQHARHKFGVGPEVEFHGHQIMQAQGEWTCMSSQLHEAVALYRNVLRAIVGSKATVLLEGVDVRRLNARYRYPDSPYEVTLRHLLERADSWCATWGVTCQVTADLIDRQQDFAEAIAGYTRVGTPGFRPSRLERILGPEWVDSRTEPGVQAADMVAYILRRHEEVQGSPKAQRAARSLSHVLSPAVRHQRKWIP